MPKAKRSAQVEQGLDLKLPASDGGVEKSLRNLGLQLALLAAQFLHRRRRGCLSRRRRHRHRLLERVRKFSRLAKKI